MLPKKTGKILGTGRDEGCNLYILLNMAGRPLIGVGRVHPAFYSHTKHLWDQALLYKYTVSQLELSRSIRPRSSYATMRRHTIAKTLALFLGILSVVARGLPERRLEINDGGKQFDTLMASHRPLLPFSFTLIINYAPLIPDVGELDLVEVSEGVLEGNIHTPNTTFPKRDEKAVYALTYDRRAFFAARPAMPDCKVLLERMQIYSALELRASQSTSPSLPQDYDTKLTDTRNRLDFVIPNL